MSSHIILMLVLAFVTFVVVPIVLVWSIIDSRRRKPDDRRGGAGGISSVVGGAMLEMDRFIRPSVEHRVETETPVLKREDDTGGE